MDIIIIILVALWVLGIISIPGLTVPKINLFTINNHSVSLFDVFLFVVAWWLINHLPSPLQEIAVVLLLLWALSVVGIIAIAGASSMFGIAIVAGTILYIISKLF